MIAGPGGRELSLADLLAVEDDPGFVDIVCPDTGVMVWPTIRTDIIRMVMSDLMYRSRPLVDVDRKIPAGRIALAAGRAAAHNRLRRVEHSRVLLLASGAGLVPRAGTSFNKYTDYFADALPGATWSLEALFGDAWPALPRGNRRLSFAAPYKFALALGARAVRRAVHWRIARDLVALVDGRTRRVLDWRLDERRRQHLEERCALRLASYPLQRRWLAGWLTRVRPRLLLAEEGCYSHMAVFNATARELGVATAEYQHGVVTRGTEAYNLAPRLTASAAFRRTQPDAFLGYGAWGNAQFNTPVERVVLGNPHREETLAGRSPDAASERRDVVVLGEGWEAELYLELCAELARRVPRGLRVVFRPHPLQRAEIAAKDAPAGVAIDLEPDIYATLARAYAVIGEVSTGLFDAVGVAERVLVWNTAKSRWGLPEHPFATFDAVDDLAHRLEDPRFGLLSADAAEAVWASGWRARFLGYIDRAAS